MNYYKNATLYFGIKLKFSKIFFSVLVVGSLVTLVCWRLLRPVEANNGAQSGSAPYLVTFNNDSATGTAGTTVTFTGDDSSSVLTLGEQGGALTYSSYAKGGQTNFKILGGAQRTLDAVSPGQINRVIINGGSGDNTLIINNPAGSLFAPNAEIEYHGGSGYDTLVLQGGGGSDFHVTYTPGPTRDAGLIETTNGQVRQVINFTGLEPVQDNVPAATAVVNGNVGNNAINYVKGPGGGIFVGNTGLVTVDNLESFEFNNKTNLVINGLAGDDTINLNYQNTANPAGLTGTITVNGGDPSASDTLILNGIAGVLDNLRYRPTSVGAGTVINDDEPQPNVNFTGIEHLTEVVQQADGDGVRQDGTTGNDAIEFFHGVTSDSGNFVGTMDQNNATGVGPFTMTPMNFTGAAPQANDTDVNFFGAGGTDSLVFNGTGNDDNIVVTGGEAGGTNFRNTLNGILVSNLEVFNVANCLVRGLEGNDNVTLNVPAGPAAVTLRVEGGDSDVSTDTVNYNAPAGAATGINYGTSAITSTAPAGNPVTFSGVEVINETSSGFVSTLTITGTTGADSLSYTPSAATAGTVTATGLPRINFTGVGNTFTIDPAAGIDTVSVNGTASNDTINAFRAGANVAVQVSTFKTVNMPSANTEALQVFGGLGDDQLNVNVGAAIGSDVIPVPLTLDGGAGSDLLDVFGTPTTVVNSVVATVGPAPGQGRFLYQDAGAIQIMKIDYVNLEPAIDLVPATNLTVNGTDADNNISYSAVQIIGAGGRVAVDDFEPIEFANKTNLVINALGGSDTINLNNPTRPPGLSGNITVNGGDPGASDTLIVNGKAGVLDNLRYLPTAVGAGTVLNDDNALQPNVLFTGVEHLTAVVQQSDGDGVRVDGTTGNDSIEYFHGQTADSGQFTGTMDQNNATGVGPFPMTPMTFAGVSPIANDADVNFFNPGGTDAFNFNGTSKDDNITIGSGEAGGTDIRNTVNGIVVARVEVFNVATGLARGLGGSDTFNLNLPAGPSATALTVEGGDSSDTINYNPPANATTTIDYGAATITSTAPAANPVTFASVETINENSTGANPTLTVNGTASGENITFTPTGNKAGTVSIAGLSPVTKFSGIATLTLGGADGNDFFNITPSSTVTVNVLGGNPVPPASPGDSLIVNTAGTTGASQTNSSGASGLSGSFTFTNRQTVNFQEIETLSPLTVTGRTFNAVEGVPFSNQIVGSFNAGAIAASNFTATINWGDGSASSTGVVVVNGSAGAFNVLGGHTYTEEGSYNVVVQVTDATTGTTQQATSTATVADAPLSIIAQPPGSSTQFTGIGGTNAAGNAFNAMTAFQAAIGGVNNGGTASPQNGGFRAINWDGVALAATDGPASNPFTQQVIVANHVVGIPTNRFQERGMNFQEVYAVADDGFTSVNPGVAGQFPAFSPTKTFAMFNDNTIDFNFVLPSTHTTNVPIQGVTRGFGAIFLDVETANTTSIEYFNGTTSLGKFFVPVGATGQAQFFGVLFQNPVVTNVSITLGNATLFSYDGTAATSGPADAPPATELAVTDDFVYPEPQAVATGININAVAGTPLTAKVASFRDADPNGQASDYSVVIDWGDGTSSSGGVSPNAAQPDSETVMDMNASITPSVNGGFDVTGTHTYASAGSFTITTSIRDIGGASISASSTATVTGQPSISINDVTLAEGNAGTTNFVFTATLSAANPLTTTVNFATSNGTATAGSDYQPALGTLTFSPGITTQQVTVLVNGDTQFEPDENFFVNLSGPTNASITKAVGIGTITNDDPTPPIPVLSVNNVTLVEGNGGTTNAPFTVTLSSASSQTVTVDYVTADGSATAPADYDPQASTLSFPPGVTTRTINIAVKADTVPEPNENFFVNLLNPVNATIGTAQGTCNINDDDEDGFVQFSAATATVAENAATVSLTVTRTGNTSGVTAVNFETSDGTAVQKSDYTFNFGVVLFNPGDTSKTIKVSIVDDVFVEGPETFKVSLSNVSGNFVINNPNQVTVTITDNDAVPPVSNPIDDPNFFVRQHYLDFLGREPDAGGLAYWVGQINACGANASCIAAARVNTSAAFFLSIEYQETSGAVVRLQRAAFGKFSADPVLRVQYLPFMRDTRQVGAGVIVGQPGYDTLLEQNKQAYALQLVNSQAFLDRFPIMPAAAYVDAIIASTGLTPTVAERTAAINAFGAGGTLGRVAALRSIADSNTVRQAELIPSFVLAEYFGYLRRNPTDAPDFNDNGYQFWLAKLTQFNGDFVKAEMVKAFIASGEYRQRFGP